MTGGPAPDDGPDTRELRRDVDFLKSKRSWQDIPARLTAYDSATGFYSWTWRAFGGLTNATRTDNANTVTGTPTINPARTPNGQLIGVLPFDCWLRPVGQDPILGTIYEIIGYEKRFSGVRVAGGNVTIAADVESTLTLTYPMSGSPQFYDTSGYLTSANELTIPVSGYYLVAVTIGVMLSSSLFNCSVRGLINTAGSNGPYPVAGGSAFLPSSTLNPYSPMTLYVSISGALKAAAGDTLTVSCLNYSLVDLTASITGFVVTQSGSLT